jgi:hypothetical protein
MADCDPKSSAGKFSHSEFLKPGFFRTKNFCPEIFARKTFLCRIFLGVKILRSDFFWMRNYFVWEFLDKMIVRAGKMVGLMDCRLPFLIDHMERTGISETSGTGDQKKWQAGE